MPMFKLPLSGDVTQAINPWTFAFNPVGGQFGLVNVTLGQSSAPQVEADVLTDVAGYGKQLGRIIDALQVVIKHLPKNAELSEQDRKALHAFEQLHAAIEAVKERHAKDKRNAGGA